MNNRLLKTVEGVVSWRLCTGCGACVSACPENNIRLVDVPDQGLRPVVNRATCQKCGECIKVCPGIEVSHRSFDSEIIPELRKAWGPVLEVWQGYASDRQIRFNGSSGGIATALSLYCVEQEKCGGVLHIGAQLGRPLENVPVFSKSRRELLANTGSRYSPAGPCERIDWIQEAASPCVFVGKPCDVVALRKLQAAKPELNGKVGLAISIFCAGTPSTNGTRSILDALGVTEGEVKEIRYRGCGWPGTTTVKLKGSNSKVRQMSYEQSWGGILSRHGQFRCRLCPDSTGEFADISCGDAWYREIEPNDLGWSLILARTEKGRKVVRHARQAGYITLKQVGSWTLPASQEALLKRRRHLWGRLLAMRMMQVPSPHFGGFFLFANWRRLPAFDKARSVLGTLYRAISRKWNKPLPTTFGD
jgi:coenzyme F420 hydrogenase subunit beta